MKTDKLHNKQMLSRSLLQEEIGGSFILKIILIFFVLLVLFFLYWSFTVSLNETISANGDIEALTAIDRIQHPTGGKIAELYVEERQHVAEGDPLLKLDDSQLLLKIQEEESDIYYLVTQQNLLLEELEIMEKLHSEKLTSTSDYLRLRREIADIKGKINSSRKRLEIYILQKENSILTASLEGYIHGLNNRKSGTVIRSGETVMSIIPDDIRYVGKVRIPAARIGQIKVGQSVKLKFTSYDSARYGVMKASLDDISPTTFLDNNRNPYYQGIIYLPENHLGDKEDAQPILQGMTVAAEISTGAKTLFQYLFMPVKASGSSAFHEP